MIEDYQRSGVTNILCLTNNSSLKLTHELCGGQHGETAGDLTCACSFRNSSQHSWSWPSGVHCFCILRNGSCWPAPTLFSRWPGSFCLGLSWRSWLGGEFFVVGFYQIVVLFLLFLWSHLIIWFRKRLTSVNVNFQIFCGHNLWLNYAKCNFVELTDLLSERCSNRFGSTGW